MMQLKIIAYDQNGHIVNTLLKRVADAFEARAWVMCQFNNPRTEAIQYWTDNGNHYPAMYRRDIVPEPPNPCYFDVHYQPHEIMNRSIH